MAGLSVAARPGMLARMDADASLRTGLQEWASCCRAFADGRLWLSIRKGGIHERHGGLFTLEHERFLLLPTHLHQDPARLRAAYRADAAATAADPDPDAFLVGLWAEADRVWRVDDLERILALGDALAWSEEEVERRFRYRDEPWLAVLALRIHRLPARRRIPVLPRYGGCRSWIELAEAVPLAGSRPVIDDAAWRHRLLALDRVLGEHPPR